MYISKSLFIFTLMLSLSACTPEMKYQLQKDWQAFKDYDVWGSVKQVTGFNEAFPDNYEKMVEQDRNLCLHEDAHDRVIKANGFDDEVGYRHCTLSPAPPATPHRWNAAPEGK